MGRGQFPAALGVAVIVTYAGSVAILTFTRPVVVTAPIPLTVTGLTAISQAVISPTVVTITYSGPLVGLAYLLASGTTAVQTYQGGPINGTYGTFGGAPPTGSSILSATDIGSGNYNVQFSSNISAYTSGLADKGVAFWSSIEDAWSWSRPTAQPAADTLTFEMLPNIAGATLVTIPTLPLNFNLVTPPTVPQTHTIP
jgi:hypothetical protein